MVVAVIDSGVNKMDGMLQEQDIEDIYYEDQEFKTCYVGKLNPHGTEIIKVLLKEAPDFARGFIGIAYRIHEDDTKFESFYVRPTNGRQCDDPVRKQHGCQYFSYPTYTFAYFREHGITKYENQVDIDINEWISLKAVIEDEKAIFYLNDDLQPLLVVNQMIHDKSMRGNIGFFVDIGTEAFFKDLKITYFD